jgi:hypothetical protein
MYKLLSAIASKGALTMKGKKSVLISLITEMNRFMAAVPLLIHFAQETNERPIPHCGCPLTTPEGERT